MTIDAVVIGASAGGIEAMIPLLEAVQPGISLPLIAVVHLPPDSSGSLPEIFARYCKVPVKEAEDKEPILSDMVYVAPPDYHLFVEAEKYFSLTQDEPEHYSRPSIDLLFESAAHTYKDKLLGIILTGANSDGARGLQIIRNLGGVAWVQDPNEAQARIMPSEAIAHAGADSILSIKQMALKLAHLSTTEGVRGTQR